MSDADKLPAKFTQAERDAHQWLYDCGCTGWAVDLLTKRVTYLDGEDAKKARDLCELANLFNDRVWDGNIEPEDTDG